MTSPADKIEEWLNEAERILKAYPEGTVISQPPEIWLKFIAVTRHLLEGCEKAARDLPYEDQARFLCREAIRGAVEVLG